MPKKHREKQFKKAGICVYCGRIEQLSEDHIIPQCLFAGKCPPDTPSAYACMQCNNVMKSKYDAYLRDLLFMDMHSYSHPVVQQLWDKFARSVARNQSPAAKDALPTSQIVALHTPSGIFQEWAYEMKLPHHHVSEALSMMIRGLYQYAVNRRLPQDSKIEVNRIQGKQIESFQSTIQILQNLHAPYITVGDGQVFRCIFACSATDPDLSLWFLCFYSSVVFSVVTNRHLSKSTHSSNTNTPKTPSVDGEQPDLTS